MHLKKIKTILEIVLCTLRIIKDIGIIVGIFSLIHHLKTKSSFGAEKLSVYGMRFVIWLPVSFNNLTIHYPSQ